MFIQTQNTPNPNAIQFLPGLAVSSTPIYFQSADEAQNTFLVRKLLNIADVEGVFLGSDFITVSKNDNGNWDVLRSEIITLILDHFASGLGVFDNLHMQENNQEEALIYTDPIEQQIVEIINTRVRPSVAMDGGDIVYQGFENGIVKLELRGACAGCPSSTITLKNGIESMLKHYVPQVIAVEAVNQ